MASKGGFVTLSDVEIVSRAISGTGKGMIVSLVGTVGELLSEEGFGISDSEKGFEMVESVCN